MKISFFKILGVIGSFMSMCEKVIGDGRITASDLVYVLEFLSDEFGLPVELDLSELEDAKELFEARAAK